VSERGLGDLGILTDVESISHMQNSGLAFQVKVLKTV
jgi:hypothetical protein